MPGPPDPTPDARTLTIEIETLTSEGDGLGHAPDGRVVFVPFTAPGDRVRVRVKDERRRFLRAEAETLERASEQRTDPLCPVFGQCGGCSWQHLDYGLQVEAKRTIVRDAYERIAKLTVSEIELVPSPSPYATRGRARVVAQRGRVGFRRRRSHAVVPVSRCPVLVPELDAPLRELAGSPPAGAGEWILSAGDDGGTALGSARGSSEAVTIRVGEDSLRVSTGSFLQAHVPLREKLASLVHELTGSGARAADLYAGAGFFTLGLCRNFASVLAVESNPFAVADLEENAERAGVADLALHATTVEDVLDAGLVEAFHPEVMVLDPPRVGLSSEVRTAVIELEVPRIVYVSCDPATQARDVGELVDRGYTLERLIALDLFPQTPHVETIALLTLPHF